MNSKLVIGMTALALITLAPLASATNACTVCGKCFENAMKNYPVQAGVMSANAYAYARNLCGCDPVTGEQNTAAQHFFFSFIGNGVKQLKNLI